MLRPRLSERLEPRALLAGAACALLYLGSAATSGLAQGETARPSFSARFMAEAIATSGSFAFEECPSSQVEEHSAPGCARIPAALDTARRWLDLMEETVFLETSRIGAWQAERGMSYVVWRLDPTDQRYLLVLAPHPTNDVTILYVSELADRID